MFHTEDQSTSQLNSTPLVHPNYLVCPLTGQIFLNPVIVTPSGHTFEQEYVEKLIALAKQQGKVATCPLTRQEITGYVIAWSIKAAVQQYLESTPEAKIDLYNNATNTSDNAPLPNSLPETTSESPHANHSEQMQADERLARELQREMEDSDRERRLREERTRRSNEAFRARQERRAAEQQRERERARSVQQITHRQARPEDHKIALYGEEKEKRNTLIQDIKNLIYALGFEEGPRSQGTITNPSLLAFALIETIFLPSQPWQKIKIQDGPKSAIMHTVLKAAIQALEEINKEVLNQAIEASAHTHDLVKTKFGGEVSLSNGGYAKLALMAGTVNGQPGYLVDQILARVNYMLNQLSLKHASQVERNLRLGH